METLIVQPSSQSKLEALKAFLTALKIDFLPAESKKPVAIITDPETIQLIEDFEQGRIRAIPYDLADLKAVIDAQP